MGVVLFDDLMVLGLGIHLGVKLFHLDLCWLVLDLIPAAIIQLWCLKRGSSPLIFELVRAFYNVVKFFRLLTKS